MARVFSNMGGLGLMVMESALLIVVGLIYFIITLGIVKWGAKFIGYQLSGDWAVLSASIIVAAIMVGSSFKN